MYFLLLFLINDAIYFLLENNLGFFTKQALIFFTSYFFAAAKNADALFLTSFCSLDVVFTLDNLATVL